MTEEGQSNTALDEKADRVLEELGLDLNGPPTQLTYDAGRKFGERFGEFLPLDQEIIDEVLREILGQFVSMFPKDPDPETVEFQAYFLGPLVNLFLSGRGLTIPEMAVLARVTREHAYRLNRKGLSIMFGEQVPQKRVGVNRRFDGRDDREHRLVLDTRGFTKKPWPAPAEVARPFMLGMMEGLAACLERPEVRGVIEPAFMRGFAALLADPKLGDLMDGVVLSLDRIAQGLRDTAPGQTGPILRMKAEREKAFQFQAMLSEIRAHRDGVVRVLAYTGECIERNRKPDKAEVKALLDRRESAAG